MEKGKASKDFFMHNPDIKSKSAMEKTLNDVAKLHSDSNFGVKIKTDIEEEKIKSSLQKAAIDAYNKELDYYNSGELEPDADYSGVEINGYNVMVRVYAMGATMSNGGIYMLPSTLIPIPTKSGQGILDYKMSPYNFSHKAVVITGGNTKFKKGDIVHLAVLYLVAPQAGNAEQTLPRYGFALYDYIDFNVYANCKNIGEKHYGYMLLPESSISVTLKKAKS